MQFDDLTRELAAQLSDDELAAMISDEDVAESLTDDELAELIPDRDLGELLHNEELAELLPDEEIGSLIPDRDLGTLLTEQQMSTLLTEELLRQLLTVQQAQAAIKGAFGRGASRWVAQAVGIAPRTARRWLSASPPRARHADIIALAVSCAADTLRENLAADASLDLRTAIIAQAPGELRAAIAAEAPFETRAAAAGRASAAQRAAAIAQAPADLRAAVAGRAAADARTQAAAGVSVGRRASAALRKIPRERRAAKAMGGCSGHVAVGTVEVQYDDDAPETRRIGDVDIDLTAVIEALDAENPEVAAEEFAREVLEAYGPGLGDTLKITNFRDGITLT